MDHRILLRLEGLVAFGAAAWAYYWLGGSLVLFVVLFLLPDLSMVGYLRDPRTGAATYNAVHTYVGPAALAGLAIWGNWRLGLLLALIWIAHVGGDRLVGYGLKLPSGFRETHLG